MIRNVKLMYIIVFILLTTTCLLQTGCALFTDVEKNLKEGFEKADTPENGELVSEEEQKRAELEETIIESPFLIDAEYFRKTAGDNKPVNLFGDPEREKELEERLARLEKRLQGVPERSKDTKGLPVLKRKVVLLSLLGDLGLDILSLLPASLRRTDGVVPVNASRLAELLKSRGRSVADLASVTTRREIAAIAGIQAYILVYFPQAEENTGVNTSPQLRLDVIHAIESVLIGSYLTTIDEFDEVAIKISKDVVRSTDWSCRIVETLEQENSVILNSGRLTGLQPGDRLKVFGMGREIIDTITKRSLGYGPGKLKGELEVESLFGTDASRAIIKTGVNLETGDIVKISELAY